jgi:micrococcal nuclease
MINKAFIISLFLFSFPFLSSANYFHDITVERVIDGDTIVISIPELPEVFGKKISVRLAGIDTPELRAKCPYEKGLAIRAKDRIEGLIIKGRVISIGDAKRDKYFRLLANVLVDGENVTATLLEEGLAVTYSGGRKRDWCNYRKIR